MDDHASQPLHPTRGTIDSRDHFVEGLYRILERLPVNEEGGKAQEIFLAYSQLAEWSQKLAKELESFTVSLSSSGSRQEETCKQMYVLQFGTLVWLETNFFFISSSIVF